MSERFRVLAATGDLTEGWVLAMAFAAVGGAVMGPHAPHVGLAVALACGLVALASRRPMLVVVSVMLIAGSRSSTEAAAFQPIDHGLHDGVVRLVTDPENSSFGWRAEAALADGRRVRLTAHGQSVGPLAVAEAGESFVVVGQLKPVTGSSWLKSRHIVGGLQAASIVKVAGIPWYWQPSHWLRSLVAESARAIPDRLAPLYLGLVIGDDREQSLTQQAQFRAAGLSHLLAVSGQNVAFVLAVTRPLLGRLGVRSRLALTLAVLAVFAMATRLEPSVMRATFTAGMAAWSLSVGRRTVGTRALGLATTLLLIIDPFLVSSVGFQLSVGASLAIILFGPAIISRIQGPALLAEAAGITIAAQLGVAPILFAVFGPVSLVTVPANVLAGWAAGVVMMWGMSGGLVAALLPTAVGGVLQMPAAGLVWWIDAVGAASARAPLPLIGPLAGLVLVLAIIVDLVSGRRRSVRLALASLMLALLWDAVPSPPIDRSDLVGGATWYPGGGDSPSVLVVERHADGRVLEALTEQRITTIDVMVVTSPTSTAGRLANQITEAISVGWVVAPPLHRVLEGHRLLGPMQIVTTAGPLGLEVSGGYVVVIPP